MKFAPLDGNQLMSPEILCYLPSVTPKLDFMLSAIHVNRKINGRVFSPGRERGFVFFYIYLKLRLKVYPKKCDVRNVSYVDPSDTLQRQSVPWIMSHGRYADPPPGGITGPIPAASLSMYDPDEDFNKDLSFTQNRRSIYLNLFYIYFCVFPIRMEIR